MICEVACVFNELVVSWKELENRLLACAFCANGRILPDTIRRGAFRKDLDQSRNER